VREIDKRRQEEELNNLAEARRKNVADAQKARDLARDHARNQKPQGIRPLNLNTRARGAEADLPNATPRTVMREGHTFDDLAFEPDIEEGTGQEMTQTV